VPSSPPSDLPSVALSAWQRFSSFLAKGGGKERGHKLLPVIAEALPIGTPNKSGNPAGAEASASLGPIEEMRKKVAIKCDLCAGYDNQACVQACPTGAALRIKPAQFFGSTENILRQRTT
jgi:ferredoxin